MVKDSLWDKKNTVHTYPDRVCLACDQMYSPDSFWSERCPTCKRLNKPKFKTIYNKNFEGIRPLPLNKLRIKLIDGKQYPSVTTVLHPEGIDYPEVLLNQYAARGTLVHKQIELFLQTGKWYGDITRLPKAVGKSDPEYQKLKDAIKTMQEGSLGLKTEHCSFPGFYAKYGRLFTFNGLEVPLVNTRYVYCGTTDCEGTYRKYNAIADWKTASSYPKDKVEGYFEQLSAYANTDNLVGTINRLVIVPLNPKSPRGFEAPIVTKKVNYYFKRFLIKRKQFKKIYGI